MVKGNGLILKGGLVFKETVMLRRWKSMAG